MGRLFKFCLFVIAVFSVGAAIGFFLPAVKSVERSTQINATPYAVYPYLSDMNDFEVWSPWKSDAADYEYLVGGAENGVGQRAAWTCESRDCLSGMQEVLVMQPPEFVQTELYLQNDRADATYAIMRDENFDDRVTVLVKVDLDVGDFPYIQRLFRFRRDQQLARRLDEGLARLKAFAEADVL